MRAALILFCLLLGIGVAYAQLYYYNPSGASLQYYNPSGANLQYYGGGAAACANAGTIQLVLCSATGSIL